MIQSIEQDQHYAEDIKQMRLFHRVLIVAVCVFLVLLSSYEARSQKLDVPYVPTPQPVVEQMLEIAEVGPGDYMIDLGSGDGRIVIAAAQKNAVGHGVDLDPEKVREARENARTAGVDDRTLFFEEDIFETEISNASVITMYLLPSINIRLRPRLLNDLEPGTRVVSHSFDMDEWHADGTYNVKDAGGEEHTVYLWIIPARVEGTWSWEVNGDVFKAEIDQRFQNISVTSAGSVDETVLRGRRVGFRIQKDDLHYIYSGRVEGDTIEGVVQVRDGEEGRIFNWTAKRN